MSHIEKRIKKKLYWTAVKYEQNWGVKISKFQTINSENRAAFERVNSERKEFHLEKKAIEGIFQEKDQNHFPDRIRKFVSELKHIESADIRILLDSIEPHLNDIEYYLEHRDFRSLDD